MSHLDQIQQSMRNLFDEGMRQKKRANRAEAALAVADANAELLADGLAEAERELAGLRANIEALADKWQAEVDGARAYGIDNPKSSKAAHAKALRNLLGTEVETVA